jgi:hypothetical protein
MAVLVGAAPALAQDPATTVLVPGEFRSNIAAAGKVLQLQGNLFADFRSWAAVSFERADSEAQNIKLEAKHPVREFPVFGTAIARGMLFLDFCVPSSGAVVGCGSEPAVPEVVTATITFGYGYAGHLSALGLTSEATFDLTASVLDRAEQRYVHIQQVKNVSVKGQTVSLADVPIPIPGIENHTLTRPISFTLILKRGRIYRYQLAAAVTTTKGLVQSPAGSLLIHAVSDFAGPISGLLAPVDGFVQLRNLTIAISPDLLSVQDALQSLQEQVATLVGQLDQLRTDHHTDVTVLREELAALRLAIEAGPQACVGAPPDATWRCVAGRWVPPRRH